MPKKKPSGINTVLEVGHKGVKQHQTEMPTAKDEAERKLIEIFLASAPDLPKHGLVVLSTKQNAENEFDFTLKISTGDRYIELVEFGARGHEAPSFVSRGCRHKSLSRRRMHIRLPLSCEFLRFGYLRGGHLVGGIF
jgi:hypothetical protein